MNALVHFSRLGMLHLFWIVPLMVLFLYLAGRHARRALGRITRRGELAVVDPARRTFRLVLYLAALALLVVAMMRPGWNPEPVTVRQEGRDVVFVVDVSRSMLAQDLAPNRLERAKLAILDVLPMLDGDRVGVVAFAGSATVVCPLTRDYGFFRWAVEGLSPASTTEGGTLLGDAIRKVSEDVFDPQEKRYKDVLLISDGEDQDSFPVEAAALAGAQGVRIIAIGLGDEATGSRIPVSGSPGNQVFLTDRGREVWTRLHPEILRQVALATPGGRYLHAATGVFDLGEIYRDLVRNEAGRDLGEMEITRYQEKFQLFLAVVFGLLVLEMLTGDVKNPVSAGGPWKRLRAAVGGTAGRLRAAVGGKKPTLHSPAGPGSRGRPAAVHGTRGLPLLLLPLLLGMPLVLLPGAEALVHAGGAVPERVEEGNQAYQEGAYHDAAARYETAREEDPDSPVPLFNMGVALYRQGNYTAALTAFQSLQVDGRQASDRNIVALAHYNQGNALARMGRSTGPEGPQDALRLYERSIAAYQRALDLDPEISDAAYNIEVVRHWIEELRDSLSTRAGEQGSEQRPSPRREQQPGDRQPSPPGDTDPDGGQDEGPDSPQAPEAPQAPVQPRDEPGIPRDETAQSILQEERQRREAEANKQGGARSDGRPTW